MSVTSGRSPRPVVLRDIKGSPKVRSLIDGANDMMKAMGYTEHGHRHVEVVAGITRYILEKLESPDRYVELSMIAAHLHDIGNVINRIDHPLTGANLAYQLLNELGMPVPEISLILGAIGNHEELAGAPISLMGAAVIIADKSDVHRTRVQNPILETFDIHDRVNYAVTKSRVDMDTTTKTIALKLDIDQTFATVMEYFEIFLSRMVMCRKAAQFFGYRFTLEANGTHLE
ncbi:MAG: HD domain-containing protein [Chthonomonadaceae bacterium]|jgi:metal-dependent HD superfamily phosphatase/phosphodiesterase|nr:HD domain-containing protein [Chthonomonadaceae bacterium]